MKSDEQIQKDVLEQLKWEPSLDAAAIGVSVKKGVVTLSGIVDTYYKKVCAESAAKKITGVKAVAEDIQVGISPSYKKTDTEIAEAVLHALRWHSFVPEDKIKVKVEDGVVTLEGEVTWDYQRTSAKKAIENLAGVRKIISFISLKPSVTAANVKDKILAAFYRSATIDADNVTIQVIGNKAVLTGKVRSYAEREDAEHAAWSAPGINQVENLLKIQEEVLSY